MNAYLLLVTESIFEGISYPCRKFVAVNSDERWFDDTVKVGDSPEYWTSSADAYGVFDVQMKGTVVQILD